MTNGSHEEVPKHEIKGKRYNNTSELLADLDDKRRLDSGLGQVRIWGKKLEKKKIPYENSKRDYYYDLVDDPEGFFVDSIVNRSASDGIDLAMYAIGNLDSRTPLRIDNDNIGAYNLEVIG